MGYWGLPIRAAVQSTNPVDSDQSCVDTIQQMIMIARSSASSPRVCHVVNTCLSILPKNPTTMDLARELFYWVKRTVRFREDEETLALEMGYQDNPFQELLITPDVLLSMPQPQGDCDDYAMLIAALLCCAHIPNGYRVIAASEQEPDKMSHVFNIAWFGDRLIPMDAAYGSMIGWEKKGFRTMDWRVN